MHESISHPSVRIPQKDAIGPNWVLGHELMMEFFGIAVVVKPLTPVFARVHSMEGLSWILTNLKENTV